jgi:hypothetical protein
MMQVNELLDRLVSEPEVLLRELVEKRESVIVRSEQITKSIENISKVIRIARDSAARRRRDDLEIQALKDALVGQGQTIDLDNLYLPPHPPLGGGEG